MTTRDESRDLLHRCLQCPPPQHRGGEMNTKESE